MKKTIPAWVLCLSLLILGCSEPYIDSEKIYTITFFPNGGVASVASMETDVRGRLASLPSAVREDDKNPDTGEIIRSYAFTGWFTTGGSEVSLKTVFHSDTLVFAQWKASDETDPDKPGPLAEMLAVWRDLDPLPLSLTYDVNTDENLKPQTLAFGGNQITVTLRGRHESNTAPPAISLSGLGALFTVEDGVTLILENIRLEGKRNNSSLVVVNSGGNLEVSKGTVITENVNENSNFGGGVTVNIGGIFAMTGGQIIRNYSSDSRASWVSISGGGGVLVRGGTFTMTGGQIAENQGYNGGGVLVNRGGIFIMGPFINPDYEYQIYKNFSYEGGGVKVMGGRIDEDPASMSSRFIMRGGSIYDNEGIGGGVALNAQGIFSMYGGEINKNSGNDAGGIFNSRGTVYMYDGSIINNKGRWNAGGVMNMGYFYMFNGKIAKNFGGFGGGVTNLIPSSGFGGYFHMWNGDIFDNIGDGSGGGVASSGFFYMHGGKIRGNTCNIGRGGGLFNGNPGIPERGLFVITGGVIYGSDPPADFDDPAHWEDYENIENSHSEGAAVHILGGMVTWGRKGYYYLDNFVVDDVDNPPPIKFEADTQYKLPAKDDPGYGEPGYEVGKRFRVDVAIGIPKLKPVFAGKDKKDVWSIEMDEDSVKQESTNDTIEVKPDGVYINGKRKTQLTDDAGNLINVPIKVD